MKVKEIQIGGTYLTKIGEERVRVVVVDRVPMLGGYQGDRQRPDRFRVRRENEARVLPKWRTAAALHPLPASRPEPTRTAEQPLPLSGGMRGKHLGGI
jgi:hypothetical protein